MSFDDILLTLEDEYSIKKQKEEEEKQQEAEDYKMFF